MAMHIELERVQTEDGMLLHGALRRPAVGAASQLGADAVIMHHGVGGNFYNPHFFDPLGDQLLDRGCAILRVNNRGHDLAYNSPKGRLGAAFESVDDCRKDWKAWIDHAVSLGFQRIALWGHSLGAVKTIYFLATEGDPRVVWTIATSPPQFSYSDYVSRPDGHLFTTYFDEAKRLVAEGKPDAVFPVTIPTNVLLAAKTYLDKYGPEERFDIVKLLPNVRVPILVTIGAKEGEGPESPDRFSFLGLADRMSDLARTQDNLSFSHIQGADHFYTGVTDDLWEAIHSWLTNRAPMAAAR
jgi:pimeloyl-ACP methyl ester carboxylesterase